MNSHLSEILDDVKQYLAFLEGIGCTSIGAGEKGLKTADSWKADTLESLSLSSLQKSLENCRQCDLANERRAVVFGQGNPGAKVMFIGSFPEAQDQNTGIPYSGEAGALLTRIIEAIGQTRESVYICHAVKCRPSSDRLPTRAEANACGKWLEKQVRAVHPQVICALGSIAAQVLLKTYEPMSRLRGIFHDYGGISVMPTYEPSYLLMNPSAKRAVWEDMKEVMACIDH